MEKRYAYAFSVNGKIVVSIETEAGLLKRLKGNDLKIVQDWLGYEQPIGCFVGLEWDMVTRIA
jgi:hypothetical protein